MQLGQWEYRSRQLVCLVSVISVEILLSLLGCLMITRFHMKRILGIEGID